MLGFSGTASGAGGQLEEGGGVSSPRPLYIALPETPALSSRANSTSAGTPKVRVMVGLELQDVAGRSPDRKAMDWF